MDPTHLQQTPRKIDIKRGSALQQFLFEDDYDFRRAIIGFLTSKAAVHRFVSRGLMALGVGILVLGLAVAAQLGSQQTSTQDTDQASAVNDKDVSSNDDSSPDVFPAGYLLADAESNPGPMASGEGQDFTLASMFEVARSMEQTGSRGLVVAQNQSGSSGGALSGIGGGGGGGGVPGGGGAARRVAQAADQTGTTVPDASNSVALLTFSLAVIGYGRFRSNKRVRKA